MFEGIPVVSLTAPALLGITILLLLMGRIVPRVTLQDKTQEAADWKSAYEAERDARARSNLQTIELLEVSKTTHAITVAMFDVVRQDMRRMGGTDVVPKE